MTTWTRTVRRLLPLLVLALAFALPAGASAAGWVGAQSLTENPLHATAAPVPQIAVDSAGNAVMAITAGKNASAQAIQVATRPAGGSWSAFTQLFLSGASGLRGMTLAGDPQGDAVLAFQDVNTADAVCSANTGCLHIFFKPAASNTFTLEKEVTAATASTSMIQPVAAMDPNGTGKATIVWHRTPTAGSDMVEGLQRSGGVWSATQTIVASQTAESYTEIHLADDASGRAIMTYAAASPSGCTNTCTDRLRSATYGTGGTWATGVIEGPNVTSVFGDPNAGRSVYLTRDGAGHVDVLYARTNYSASGVVIRTAGHPLANAATWDAPTSVATLTATDTVTGLQMAAAADGDAVAAWQEITGGGIDSISVTARPAGGSFASPEVADGPNVSNPAIAQDAAGNTTVAWWNNTTKTIRYRTRGHAGAFSSTLAGTGTTTGTDPVAASDPAGNVSVAWETGTSTVEGAVFDAANPALPALAPDPMPFTGDAVAFNASPSDLWSNPVAVHWDFGDGQTADGTSVAHTYSAAGSYMTRATATDASGNSTTQTQTVTVSQTPTPVAVRLLPRPVAGQTVNLEPVSGTVLVKLPGTTTFVPLVSPTQVQDGAIIDARNGVVRITIDNGLGGLDTSDFYGGIFQFTQPKVKAGQTWFADLFLYGGSFKGCVVAPKHPKIASASKKKTKKLSPKRSIRHLWGSGHGAFRTVGRFSSATVRGTTWLTDDRCDGTLTKVTAGQVGVRDFVLNRTIIVKRGHTHLAQPRKPKAKKSRKK